MGLDPAAAQIDAVVDHRGGFLLQPVKGHDRLLNFPAQRNRRGKAPGKQKPAQEPVQPGSLPVGLIVNGMQQRKAQPQIGQRRVLKRMQVGMEHIRLFLQNQLPQSADAPGGQAPALAQIAHFQTVSFHPVGDGGMVGIQAHRHHAVAPAGKLPAQTLAHGLCAAHAEIGDNLQDFHGCFLLFS